MVSLRPIAEADAPGVAAAVEQSRDALRRWMPWYRDQYAPQDAADWIAASRAAAAEGTGIQFAILGDTDALLGVIGFEDFSEQTGRAMIGYWLATPATRRGIGRAAIAIALDWARSQPGFRLVWAVVADANVASRRVLEANHFQLAGSRGTDERGDLALIYELELRPSAS